MVFKNSLKYFLTVVVCLFFFSVNAQEKNVTNHHPNGKTVSSGFVSSGKKTGAWTYYHENGVVSKKAVYKNDLEEGVVKTFFTDNKKNEEIYYSSGQVDSLHRYFRTGKLKEITRYSNARKDRVTILFDSIGNGKSEYFYKEGKFIKSQ